ncbi:PREDICTED: uncharacterized protein LOC103339451 [Prunus mume]|uniref:Uncharacterized protein LOC103339451 n=1 Tax=Prunus mume TaxID=102107 RepID=A0ABM1LVT7_PRUMU|nr:PREDICTED: uncharacterized protein LOC103339451 [Prunus mume]
MWVERYLQGPSNKAGNTTANQAHSTPLLSLSLAGRKVLPYPPPQCSASASSRLSELAAGQPQVRGGGPAPANLFNRTPLPPGQTRKWEDWELPCYVTSFLTIVILGVGLNAKPDLTIETWAHQKALERLEIEQAGLSVAGSSESD